MKKSEDGMEWSDGGILCGPDEVARIWNVMVASKLRLSFKLGMVIKQEDGLAWPVDGVIWFKL